MKWRKKTVTILLLITAVLLTACTNKEEKDYKMIRCTRKAQSSAGDNVKLDLSYKVYYKDDYVKKVIATDKVTSSDNSIINQYANSYKNIYASYDGLKHFSNKITVTKDSMTSITEIDYAHIDTDKLLEIEGKDDNVVNDEGKVPLKDFLAFYEKYGAKCDK